MAKEIDPVKLARRKRNLKRRIVAYGSIIGILYGVWLWTPWEYDFIQPPKPSTAPVDPDSARLFSKGTKVVVVTGHPDDAEFYLGGTLTKLGQVGADIQLITCTDGDKGYYPFEDWRANSRVRRAEQSRAAATWHGRAPIFLGFPDGRLEVSEPVVRALQREFERSQPDYILCFDGYFPTRVSHRDHRRAGRAAEVAAKRSGLHLWLCRTASGAPNWFSNIEDLWDAKSDLLAIHESQFYGEKLGRIREMVYNNAEREGALGGFGLAEGMRVQKLP